MTGDVTVTIGAPSAPGRLQTVCKMVSLSKGGMESCLEVLVVVGPEAGRRRLPALFPRR